MASFFGGTRAAFQPFMLQQHRGKGFITSLQVDSAGERYWVGYSDGVLKEFTIAKEGGLAGSKPSV